MYGGPKYGPDFTHFDYVNPDAPKGGTLKLKNPDRRSSFDKFNPWTTRGKAPAGVMIWMVEGLGHLAQDEPATVYGLLAEAHAGGARLQQRELPHPAASALQQRRCGDARGRGAQPAACCPSKHAPPQRPDLRCRDESARWPWTRAPCASTCARRPAARCCLPRHHADLFSRKWGGGKSLGRQVVSDWPILSGPYVIDKADMPRRIEFKRNPRSTGASRPAGAPRHHFNFDRVVYRNYTDNAVSLRSLQGRRIRPASRNTARAPGCASTRA